MNQLDEKKITRQVARILGVGKSSPRVTVDKDGWASLSDVCGLLEKQHDLVMSPNELRQTLGNKRNGLVFSKERLRLYAKRTQGHTPPDILYHATTQAEMDSLKDAKRLIRENRKTLYFSTREHHAWRVAHRLSSEPQVLYIDATRASRHGVRFKKNKRNGLYMATHIPKVDILNLQDNFGVQLSAGGFPIRRDDDGKIRMALIQVRRRSGISWEVAKGKLEPGETPEASACREVAEEMGIPNTFRVHRYIDMVRYGFMAPGRLPRLKTVYLYLLESDAAIGPFAPASAEGILDVKWYTATEAEKAVKHTSLKPVMRRLVRVIGDMEKNR